MTRNRYGPHRETDVPPVVVRGPGKFPAEVEAPMPRALIRQRQQINHAAYEQQRREEAGA